MKLYILASVIIFCWVIHHAITRDNRIAHKVEKDFWERERRANETRKKPLDGLAYIQIPFQDLPLDLLPENAEVQDCIATIRGLSDTKIVNLTGYTNTDLKLEYGTANITPLSQYDQSYTLLVSTLQKWADLLWSEGYEAEAASIMEFSLSTHTDTSRTYYLLAQYDIKKGETEPLSRLPETAASLRSSNREQILRHLSEDYGISVSEAGA